MSQQITGQETSAQEAITRFEENEDRFDTFVNQPGTYRTNTNPPVDVPTLPTFVATYAGRYQTPLMRDDWTAGTHYDQNDIVLQGGIYYLSTEPHDAGTDFAADLAAKKWVLYPTGIDTATTQSRGIVRIATDDEAEDGTTGGNGPAVVTPEQLKQFGGGRGGGIPLLTIIWSPLGLVDFGFLDLSQDNGLLLRSAYPDVWAKIEQAIAANTGAVVDDAAWVAEREANGGMCGKFSTGDGSTTFRVPLLRKRAGFGFPDPDTGAKHGDFLPDQMRPITAAWKGIHSSADGSASPEITTTSSTGTVATGTSRYVLQYNLDTANSGDRYSGDVTHGPLVIYTPLLKMYGAVTEASEANIAALIQQTNAKLDESSYTADKAARKPFEIVACGQVSDAGVLGAAFNVTSVTRASAGNYNIYSPDITSDCVILAMGDLRPAIRGGYVSAGQALVTTYALSSTTQADGSFTFCIIRNKGV